VRYIKESRGQRECPVAVEPEDLVLLECLAAVTARCRLLAILPIRGHDVDGAGFYSPWSRRHSGPADVRSCDAGSFLALTGCRR
jgi:hypothetical protein